MAVSHDKSDLLTDFESMTYHWQTTTHSMRFWRDVRVVLGNFDLRRFSRTPGLVLLVRVTRIEVKLRAPAGGRSVVLCWRPILMPDDVCDNLCERANAETDAGLVVMAGHRSRGLPGTCQCMRLCQTILCKPI